ncbi:MAG: hypothetical protein WEB00_11030 [Dehalococcoidia bacterium]
MAIKTRQKTKPPAVEYVTDEEAREIFEEIAQRELGISGEEFLRRYDAGEYDTKVENVAAMNVAINIPLVR